MKLKNFLTALITTVLGMTVALGVGLSERTATQETNAATTVLTEITSLDGIISGNSYLITANYNGTSGTEYYPVINGGTSTIRVGGITAGLKTAVTTATKLFTFRRNKSGFTITDGANYLYSTDKLDGLGTRTTALAWTLAYESGKGFTLKDISLNRYVTLYSSEYWRGYTSVYDYAGSQNGYLHIYSVTEGGANLESIALSGNLSKTSYTTLESWSPAGLTLTGTYDDESTAPISEGITWSYSPATPAAAGADYNGNLTITASVAGVSDASIVKTVTVSEAPHELFFTEYIESGTNKYIEIYNPSSSTITMGNYKLRLYFNGSSSPTEFTLTGTLAGFRAYTCGNGTGLITPDFQNGNLNFNGNDAIALYNGSTNVDVVGTIGSSAVFAEDKTLVRNPTIIASSGDYNASEWTDKGVNVSTYLGDAENGGTILANYVMAADTVNQCVTKYPVAKNLYLDLSTASQTYFKSTDANTRYLAWAAYHGDNSTQAYQASAATVQYNSNTQNFVTGITIISLIGLTATAGFYFIRRRKETF